MGGLFHAAHRSRPTKFLEEYPDIGEVLGWGGSRASIWVGEITASRSGYAKEERSGLILIQAGFFPLSCIYLFKRSTKVMTTKKPSFSTTPKRSCVLCLRLSLHLVLSFASSSSGSLYYSRCSIPF